MGHYDSLAETAIHCLYIATSDRAHSNGEQQTRSVASPTVVQPDSWLLEHCWQSLADAGFGNAALSVAAMAEYRQPLAPTRAIYRLASSSPHSFEASTLIQRELTDARERLFDSHLFAEATDQIDYLLYLGASAALISDLTFAISCLERLDQLPKSWDRIFVHPELRQILSESVSLIGPTPLVSDLIARAILLYSDAGAQFLQQVAAASKAPGHSTAILPLCVAALKRAILGSLHSRKVAASVFAMAGEIDAVLEQVRTIATIQDAHRETSAPSGLRTYHPQAGTHDNGYQVRGGTDNGTTFTGDSVTVPSGSAPSNDVVAEPVTSNRIVESPGFPVYRAGASLRSNASPIRQVARQSADTDVDFLVYTLKGAVDSLPAADLAAAKRQVLINQLTVLGKMSDGWTAATAVSALLKLGGIQEAMEVIEEVEPRDPTRIEGILSLINGLLERKEYATAQEQAVKSMIWAASLPEKTPARTLNRGIASAFIEHDLPEIALQILDTDSPDERDWRYAIRRLVTGRWFGDEFTDEQLYASRLKLAGYLHDLHVEHDSTAGQHQMNDSSNTSHPRTDVDDELPQHIDQIVRDLSGWAAYLLNGEALVSFYLNSLLYPLLRVGKTRYAWGLLPYFKDALLNLQSNKMASRIDQVCRPYAAQISANLDLDPEGQGKSMEIHFNKFLGELWRESAKRGIWPTVYAIEGSLPSLIKLRGPEPIIEIAQATVEQGELWRMR